MTIIVETASLDDIGTYVFEVIETDTLTEFQLVKQVNLAILSPLSSGSSGNLTSLYSLDNLIDAKIEELMLSFNFNRTTADESIEFQVPLIAEIYDFTSTGNLTIDFNKPIILPPLMVLNETEIEQRRRKLGDAESKNETEPETEDSELLERLKCL